VEAENNFGERTEGTPLPPGSIYWNQQLSGKMRFDLYGSITYGQNLVFKGLSRHDGSFKPLSYDDVPVVANILQDQSELESRSL
jgi:hypothetical protein